MFFWFLPWVIILYKKKEIDIDREREKGLRLDWFIDRDMLLDRSSGGGRALTCTRSLPPPEAFMLNAPSGPEALALLFILKPNPCPCPWCPGKDVRAGSMELTLLTSPGNASVLGSNFR